MSDEKRHPLTLPAGVTGSGRVPGGQFAKGNNGGPGRPKKARIKNAIDGMYAAKPSRLMYKRVAARLDIDLKDVPEFAEFQELQVWLYGILSLDGSNEHARELLDRSDPKPSRSQIEIKNVRGPVGFSDDKEAQEYWDKLEKEVDSDD